MTCHKARKSLADLFDRTPESAAELRAHLAECEACAREYAGVQAAMAVLEPRLRIQASPDFKERVMNKIAEPEAPARRWRIVVPRLAAVAAAVVLIVLLAPVIGSLGGRRGGSEPVVALLARSVEAMSAIESMHIQARMRTTPAENFEHIRAEYDWVPLDIWKQFGAMPRWRVEKPGRVVAMDGTSSLLLIRNEFAARGGTRPGFLGWLNLLLEPDRVIDAELQRARSGASTAKLAEENRNGARQLVLTVNRKAQGDYTNDWLRNKTISDSDHTRIYRFDAATKRLEGMQILLRRAGGDVAVFEVTGVRYNEVLNPALFSLKVPDNVTWDVNPGAMPLPRGAALPQTPRDTAVFFFDAMAREDWERVRAVWPRSDMPPRMKTALGGLRVISVGEAFRSGSYPGWFVPYEIRFRSGEVRRHNLAVRNDNSAGRWVFDGGL